MKFLCVSCDTQMEFAERTLPGDGTLAATFQCPQCGQVVAMLTNPMETRLVSSLGVTIGGREVPVQPLEGIRRGVAGGRDEAFVEEEAEGDGAEFTPRKKGPVRWSVEAVERLESVPRFVRGMVKRLYAEYARENGIEEITPDVMDRARADLGLEGM